ncbi:putative leader peptide [Tessaracoccus sp. OS52]
MITFRNPHLVSRPHVDLARVASAMCLGN